jgi:polysaccharide export outer membrane protein
MKYSLSARLAARLSCSALALASLGACALLPAAGPLTDKVRQAPATGQAVQGIEVVPVDYGVAQALARRGADTRLAQEFGKVSSTEHTVGVGDVLQVFIWEAPPAMLFTAQTTAAAAAVRTGASMVALPDQVVNEAGKVVVPFVGELPVRGETLEGVAARITQGLHGVANQPQVIVKLGANNTRNISVVGEVQRTTEVPVNPGGVRLLRALAIAGGSTHPVGKTALQITRAGRTLTVPLATVLGDPEQNILLDAGDVVTALYQSNSFTVLGAAGRNAEVDFEANGISVLQALARVGGADDNRANPAGVFLFRFESAEQFPWRSEQAMKVDGKVPTVYQFDLRDPAVFFAAQSFPMQNRDLIYISNAPAADLQKVLGVVGSIVYPFASLYNMGIIH